jgi:hypothetical protein
MNELLLPLPKSFSDFCNYNLHEAIPIWLAGCVEEKRITTVYADLFSSSLKLKDLDKSSIDAISEFTPSIINFNKLINGLILPKSDEQISKILIEHEHLSNSLNRNGIFTINDLIDFGINNISKLNYIGNKKYFFILHQISKYVEERNISNKGLDKGDSEYRVEIERIIEEIGKLESIPLDKFTINDPRFADIRHKVSKLIYYEDLISEDWHSVFYNIAKSESSIVIEALNEFKTSYNLINEMPLEGQMEHLFRLHIKSTKLSYLLGDSYNFNVLKDRLGIIENEKKVVTLQETGGNLLPPVTRERTRQVISMLLKSLSFASDNEIYIPKLHQLKEILRNNLNTKVDNVVDSIREMGLGKWRLERIFLCFDLFNIPNNFKISNALLTNSSLIKTNHNILKIGKKISRYNGAVNLQHLTRVINQEFCVNESDVEKILLSAFKKLEENWFVCFSAENQLYSHVQRLANFSKRFTLQDFRETLIKHKKLREPTFFADKSRTGFYGFVIPPSSVISKIISNHEDYNVSNGIIYCLRVDNNLLNDHNSADYQFLKYFQARNYDVATNDDMKKYFVIDGNMPEASFHLYLSYKPYLKRYAPRIYGLVGHEPNEDSVLNAKNRVQKKIQPKTEWSKNGGINIRMQITNLANFTFTTYGYDEYISTDTFTISYGDKVYKAKRSGNFWYGSISVHLKSDLMCELGDFVSIELDIETNEAKISLISENDYYVN